MDEITRFFSDLMGRLQGPMSLRLVIQPLVAAFLAIRHGRKDAREGRPPYLWAIVTDPAHRRELLLDGRKDISKVLVLAVLLDIVYQYIVLRTFYPIEALFMAFLLAVLPYLLLRGPANRLASVKRLRQ